MRDMKKSEKIGIGTLILVSISIIGLLAINRTIIQQEAKNVTEQKPTEGIIKDEQNEYSLEKAIENGYVVL